jgi:hypothetical protein
MRVLWRWLRRLVLLALGLVALLLAPVAWVEVACRGTPVADTYAPLVADPAWRRDESRTYTTYPEWHIVYAYEDYAEVIRTGDPHDFGYLSAIAGFWSSLCPLARTAAAHGGFTAESKQTIYTIGVSFTLEMALKAAYEETLGRAATWVRGAQRAPLDELSARQAAEYAAFLHQVPWYRWDFRRDADALDAAATGAFRDRERRLALGIEFRTKAAYAGVIARAVEGVGFDELRMRSVVRGASAAALASLPGVAVVGEGPEGVEIETDRYAAFTDLAVQLAAMGADFAEIAGNDDILITVLTDAPSGGALYAARRQGFGDWRELREVKVTALAGELRRLAAGPVRLEHIHDY